MGMNIGGKRGVRVEINVTPLVDIVLVLLIIFIVITPAVNDAVKLPTAKHSEKVNPSEEDFLTLVFQAKLKAQGKPVEAGSVSIEGQEAKGVNFGLESSASREQLKAFVRKHTDGRLAKRVFIKADAEIPFKYVNDLFQLCREGGADEASIVTGEKVQTEKGGAS